MLLYVKWLLSSLAVMNTDIANVTDIIKDFATHLKQIHELEMFYGDETLKSLIDHSNILVNTLDEIDLLLEEKEEKEETELAKEET